MKGDDVRARVGKIVDVGKRVGNHEVDVKGLVGVGAHPFDNGSAEGEVRHKVAVHHVEVHPVGACLVHAFYFLSHPREVAREE